MSILSCIEIKPLQAANASIIWLHGLGANGHDFEPVVQELGIPKSLAARFILPHSKEIPVTVNGGFVMPAWYDILEIGASRKINTADLVNSVTEIHKLIQREQERGIASERILIAGFSQGGAVAYHAALSYPKKLAGLIGLSTYYPNPEISGRQHVNQDIPIKIYHGTNDSMVPESLGQQAFQDLTDFGYQVEYKSYPMDHEVCLTEIEDISLFIQQALT